MNTIRVVTHGVVRRTRVFSDPVDALNYVQELMFRQQAFSVEFIAQG